MPSKEVPIGNGLETIYLIDAMAFIQRFQTLGASTFGQLQEWYMNKIMTNKPAGCQEVHFVGDRYDFGLNSLKGDERHRRGSGNQSPEYIPADNLAIPPWKTFLSNPSNKANLLSYLESCWSVAALPDGFCSILGISSHAVRVTKEGTTIMNELHCPNHEEADTRLFAHIANCRDGSKVVIQATDTDIILLSLYHYPRLSNIRQLWGEKTDVFLPIHDLVKSLSDTICEDTVQLTDTLLTCYVLSGCDSLSYPFGRGKKR